MKRTTARLLISFAITTLTCASAAAEEVPRRIGEDVTWTQAGSPYTIDRTATVSEGATLTIEPGARVELARDVSLVIEGELIARGTESEPIVFTGRDSDGTPESWMSVAFTESSVDATFERVDDYVSGSIVEHCTFEYGTHALRISGASPFVHRSLFRDNYAPPTLELAGGAAMLIEAGSRPRVSESTFVDNHADLVAYGGAIYATQSDPIIQDNVFRRNSSVYGGALATDLVASPIVGNTFEENEATITKGGAASLISTISPILNNRVENNLAAMDGAGIHICVDCFPHSTPFVMDNTIADNISTNTDILDGSAGFGAAFIRVFRNNNLHDNLRAGLPSDFGWYHHESEGYPGWVSERSIAHNWWGTTDPAFLDETVFDGDDLEGYHRVDWDPPLAAPAEMAQTRVAVTTRRLRYEDEGDDMPVFLTLYNPGAERDVELTVMLQYGDDPALPYSGTLESFEVESDLGAFALTLPENSVYFTTLLQSLYSPGDAPEHGYWHAALFDADTGERIGEVCSIRFDLETGGAE